MQVLSTKDCLVSEERGRGRGSCEETDLFVYIQCLLRKRKGWERVPLGQHVNICKM